MNASYSGMIQAGDWVGGTSQADERFIGFVDSLLADGTVKVRVTQSDREELAGALVEIRRSKLKKLPDAVPSSREELHSLIELALQTHDAEWFAELSTRLGSSPPAANESPAPPRQSFPPGRLGILPKNTPGN
ncbi:hypothetical protein [Gorillibacterium sp. sgz500922]|uniref:hypothetical protein n=1 Tax=Gorillibacterium sp. sgz500922 TaxID=3446694 RepID=UPI003F681E85